MKNELLSKTLAQIVNTNHQTASVFEKYDLDFCCKGKRSLEKACEENNLAVETVVGELNTVLGKEGTTQLDFNKLSLTALTDYIVSTHHDYTKKELPQILAYLQKITSKHGERHPELLRITDCFTSLKEELEDHMRKEELILFPRIKELENADRQYANSISLNYLKAPVAVMEHEHEHAGNLLEEIQKYSNNYTPPADACTTYRLSFAALKSFELDLHRHIHLENNILFPKAIALFRNDTGASLN
jgi:regulator of cell morphogenesis and NO signaling